MSCPDLVFVNLSEREHTFLGVLTTPFVSVPRHILPHGAEVLGDLGDTRRKAAFGVVRASRDDEDTDVFCARGRGEGAIGVGDLGGGPSRHRLWFLGVGQEAFVPQGAEE